MPYPDFLFRKKIKKFFLLLIFICVANVLWRIWVPSYYTSSQLKNYPEAVKNFDEAKQKPRSFGYSFEEENGTTLWWIQMPDQDYYEWQLLIVQTLASLGPFALFFIRDYQVRHGFTWKEAINKITSRQSKVEIFQRSNLLFYFSSAPICVCLLYTSGLEVQVLSRAPN